MPPTIDCRCAGLCLLLAACAPLTDAVTEASQAVYIRNDTDRTTIISPRSSLSARVSDDIEVNAAYAVDVWTGASIDVRTAATTAIHETRHELGLGGSLALADLTATASYRFSTEPDYESHGAVVGVSSDFAQRSTSVALFAFGGHDTVGRAHDPGFGQSLDSLGGRATLTQVVHPGGLVQAGLEATYLGGFQSSVYRYVAIGADGTCAGLSPYCVPERNPDERFRQAVTLVGRQALGKFGSFGLDYRFYVDSWGVQSHTLSPDITWVPVEAVEVTLAYRYYTQGEADFYRPRYLDLQTAPDHVTRDRKLSAQYSQGASLSTLYRVRGPGTAVLVGGLRTGVSRIDYRAFVGLDHVYAIELTAFVGIEQ